jgi:hypothetical protein
MRFGGKDGSVVVQLHDPNRLGNLLHFALLTIIVFLDGLWSVIGITGRVSGRSGEAVCDGSLSGGRSSTLSAIGHQGKNKSF